MQEGSTFFVSVIVTIFAGAYFFLNLDVCEVQLRLFVLNGLCKTSAGCPEGAFRSLVDRKIAIKIIEIVFSDF